MNNQTHGKGDKRRDNFKAFHGSSYWNKKKPAERISLSKVEDLIKKVKKLHNP